MGSTLVCTRSSVYMLGLLLPWCFHGTHKNGSLCFSDSFASSWDSFPHIGLPCPDSIWVLLPCLIVFCFVVLSCCFLDSRFF